MLNLAAVELEPSNIDFRLNRANLLMELNRPKDAIAVLQNAVKLADAPERAAAIQSQVESIQQYQAARDAQEHELQTNQGGTLEQSVLVEEGQTLNTPQEPDQSEDNPHGPRRTARGTLKDVQCSNPAAMRLKMEGGAKPLALRSRNYYKIEYSALNFKPVGELNPCKDLEGAKAKVEYFEGRDASSEGQIISIEISK